MRNLFSMILFVLFVLALAVAPVHAQTLTPRAIPDVFQWVLSNAIGDQTNQTYETVKALDRQGNPIAGAQFLFYFSDSPAGNGLTATASSGTSGTLIGTGTGSTTGTIVGVGVTTTGLTAGTQAVTNSRVPMEIQTGPAGTAIIGVLDSAKTLFFPVVQDARKATAVVVGTKFTTGSYK